MSLSPAPLADAAFGAPGLGPGLALTLASGLALLGYAWVGLLRARAGEAGPGGPPEPRPQRLSLIHI